MDRIRLESVSKVHPGGVQALADLDLEVAAGEFLVLVGPSGCGKSTALRIVAGLDSPTTGRVFLGGDDVTDWLPQRRDLAMVFQSYALYPHKSVRGNLEFGLRMRRLARAEIEARVIAVAERLELTALLERRPAQLSGGERQRVALGRAIVREPRAFLLDEPLSNLDAKLRGETRTELARLHRRLGATMLHVTHDQEEAMTLGDRIAVLRDGRLLQVGAPMEVYDRPANVFVAGFIGTPPMNLLEPVGPWEGLASGGAGETILGVRPEDVLLAEDGGHDVEARVESVESLGSTRLLHLDAGAGSLRALIPANRSVAVGERLPVRLRREALHVFDARTGERR